MFSFPEKLYTDVRIEDLFETRIIYSMGRLEESKVRQYKAAFIRVFDGEKWYYSATSELDNIQQEINTLAAYATPNANINEHPVVQRLQANTDKMFKFEDLSVKKISSEEKLNLLKDYSKVLQTSEMIKSWKGHYRDKLVVKEFYSSKGADLRFDVQIVGISMDFTMVDGEKRLSESFRFAKDKYSDIVGKDAKFMELIKVCEDFTRKSVPVKPGKYTVVLSPLAAGIFAHESFGHKSEADFMIGDENMKKEWAIGKQVGTEILTIVDDGNISGSGYTPFDDEGTRANTTYIIKDGKLSGRLHSAVTAASLEEEVTGNCRSINFEWDPIVRMTTTYIGAGEKTKEELISEVKEGIFVETVSHGSGMSTFTIAPLRSYYIRDGKLAEPVSISVITGNVMETLGEIDGVSDEVEIVAFVLGGCGKFYQGQLPVGFGGPYVRVNNMNVQ